MAALTSHAAMRLIGPVTAGEPRRLLIMQNPGRGSHHCLQGMIAALNRMGVAHCVLQLAEVWSTAKSDPKALIQNMSQILVRQKIAAALGYGFNGLADFPLDPGPGGPTRSFLEIRGIPHLMWWLDHPHWHSDQLSLRPDLQPLLRSANSIHFLKSSAHALELERMLGWPNCFSLPVAVDPAQFPVSGAEIAGGKPEFDLVVICGDRGELPAWMKNFAAQDDPDPDAIRQIILREINESLEHLWQSADAPIRPELTLMGRKWAQMKTAEPFSAAMRHWPALTAEFPGACWYLTLQYPLYFKALRILWRIREWERRFYLAYLAKYFKIGVFGGDLSALGLGPGGWVDYPNQSATYARGKVALSIIDGHDEEGLTLKPFEIAASGVPMLHYRAQTLENCFEPNREIQIFQRPAEAREKLAALLASAPARADMAHAAHARTLQDHTWENRLPAMLAAARLPLKAFQN